jgi:hypothetical protein
MTTRTYREFDVLVDKPRRDPAGLRGLTVRLLASPVGDGPPVKRSVPAPLASQLSDALAGLVARQLDEPGIIQLGRLLADVLLPTEIRTPLSSAIDGLGPADGLRIRLRLDPAVADIPWEFVWVERQAGQGDATGFLALDPRLSIVRHQAVAGPLPPVGAPRDRRVLAALANPLVPNRAPLDLPAERANLTKALGEVPGISVDFVEDATIEALTEALQAGADVFHFAGHGIGDNLVLVDDQGGPWRLPAEQLAIDLRARGVQMAVLGACESAARTESDGWSGVATRLVSVGIPAVVAMQYTIGDRSAVAFSDRLYRSLAADLTLDEAVSAGRLAIFNAMNGGRHTPDKARLWQDWGVPVVYLRPDVAVTLASVADPVERDRLADELAISVRLRARTIGKGGRLVGHEAGVISAGRIDVDIKADRVDGTIIGVDADVADHAAITADIEVGDVTGDVTGVVTGSLGGSRATRRRTDR